MRNYTIVLFYIVSNYLGDTIRKFTDREEALQYLLDHEEAATVRPKELLVFTKVQ